MGLSTAVDWWEESQLRILVLSSLVVQWILFLSSIGRRYAIPGWIRFIIWLSYLGSDALAIYALATLFNRHKNQDPGDGGSSSILEVVWAPILLMHLGGQDGITAYNLEDNELWTRHLVTAVSQITVAVYVFVKSWPQGGDKKLLQASILLFFVGIAKCLDKPRALKFASINSLVSLDDRAEMRANRAAVGVNPLEDFVQKARVIFPSTRGQQEKEGEVQVVARASVDQSRAQKRAAVMHINEPSELFVDLAYPYPHRLSVLQYFSGLTDEQAYWWLQRGLGDVFSLLYTKLKSSGFHVEMEMSRVRKLLADGKQIKAFFTYLRFLCSLLIQLSRMVLPFAAIGLFHTSHREAYNGDDVMVTYALFVCGTLLEGYSVSVSHISTLFMLVSVSVLHISSSLLLAANMGKTNFDSFPVWRGIVAQYSLIGFFTRNKRHSKKMSVVSFFGCKSYLDQLWCMKSRFSSRGITLLVLRHLKDGWMEHIRDPVSYWNFNDQRGQGTLDQHGCNEDLGWSLEGPFDESVLLWHIATDICFYSSRSCIGHTCTLAEEPTSWMEYLPVSFIILQHSWLELFQEFEVGSASSNHQTSPHCGRLTECLAVRSRQISNPHCGRLTKCLAVRSRQISNYMLYLLFVKPEMLLPGSRRNFFITAYDELKEVLKEDKPASNRRGFKLERPFSLQKLLRAVHGKLRGIFKREEPQVEEERHMQRILNKLKSMEGSERVVFIREAWKLAEALMALGNDEKMWKVIQGVWVEMLCFSAGRCRGYLHAKALGTGGEFLSYIWLLMSHMGMETLPERLQRKIQVPVPGDGGNNTSDTPSTSQFHTVAAAPPAPENVTSSAPSTSEVPSGAIASASEIHVATGDDMV